MAIWSSLAALVNELASQTLQLIESGKENPAGCTFDLPVATQEDIELIKILLQIKLS